RRGEVPAMEAVEQPAIAALCGTDAQKQLSRRWAHVIARGFVIAECDAVDRKRERIALGEALLEAEIVCVFGGDHACGFDRALAGEEFCRLREIVWRQWRGIAAIIETRDLAALMRRDPIEIAREGCCSEIHDVRRRFVADRVERGLDFVPLRICARE